MVNDKNSSSQPVTKSHWKLLGEDALTAKDEFGHDEIVKALKETILTAPPSFCIGLVGDWGVGKSFVLKRLAEELRKQNSLSVFYFDSWKYAGESVKRSLLDSLFVEANLADTEQGKEWLVRLYNTQQKPVNPIIGTSWKLFLVRVLLPLLAGALLYGLLKGLSLLGFISLDRLVAFGLGALTAVITLAVTLANNATQVAWQTVSIPPVASADQFERILNEFLKHVFKEDDTKRAVILIDELDRCDAKTRAEVLQGLRTYLQHKRCLYVVACAPRNIRASTAAGSAADELPDEEFLRKLFNLTCWIDPQGEENLRNYARRRLEEAEIKTNNNELIQILVLGNTRNPRRIRHFLNTLHMAYGVAKAREDSERIKPGEVTGNLAFLAKVLILRQDWPDAFNEIAQEPRKLSRWAEGRSTPSDPELVKFLRSTDQIMPENPLPFLAVTMGVAEGTLKSIPGLAEAAIQRDIEAAIRIVRETPEEFPAWSELLFKELRECRSSSEDQFLVNGLIVACNLLKFVPDEKQSYYAGRICSFIQDGNIDPKSFGPQTADDVFPVAAKAKPWRAVAVLRPYIEAFLNTPSFDDQIGAAFEAEAAWLPREVLVALNQEAINVMAKRASGGDSGSILKAYNEWPKRPDKIKLLVSPELLKAFLDVHAEPSDLLFETLFRLAPAWDDTVLARVRAVLLSPLVEASTDGQMALKLSLSLPWLERLVRTNDWPDAPEEVLPALERVFKQLVPSDHETEVFADVVVGIALSLNPLYNTNLHPILISLLNRYIVQFNNRLSNLADRLHPSASSPGDPIAASTLTIFLMDALSQGKFDNPEKEGEGKALIPEIVRAVIHLKAWPEVRDVLHHVAQSSSDLSELDRILKTSVADARQSPSTDDFETLIRIIKDIRLGDRFASLGEYLSELAEWIPDLGASEDPNQAELGESLFEDVFQFMSDETKQRLASRYQSVMEDNAFRLTAKNAGFIRWISRLSSFFTDEDQILVVEKLGYLARRDAPYDIQGVAREPFQELFNLPTPRIESLTSGLINRATVTSSDRVSSLRAASLLVANGQLQSRIRQRLEKQISDIETESDGRLIEELRWILQSSS